MALDSYGNYSRSIREGTRVRRIFLGKGPIAQIADALDRERRFARAARRAEEATLALAEGRLRDLCELADLMLRATLMAAGYHQHDRGPWRRRRIKGAARGSKSGSEAAGNRTEEAGEGEVGKTTGGAEPVARDAIGGGLSTPRQEIIPLLMRAERGDPAALPVLRRLLDDRPQFWEVCGDAARAAEAAWIDLAGGSNSLATESPARQLAARKAELAGPDAPPLERLLAVRVTTCWLQMAQADAAFTRAGARPQTDARLDLLASRLDRAGRMYRAAIKALATVRNLVPPA